MRTEPTPGTVTAPGPGAAPRRRAGRRGRPPSAGGPGRACAITRTTRDRAPATAISCAQISGTSPSPRPRAAAAGNMHTRSGVAVKTIGDEVARWSWRCARASPRPARRRPRSSRPGRRPSAGWHRGSLALAPHTSLRSAITLAIRRSLAVQTHRCHVTSVDRLIASDGLTAYCFVALPLRRLSDIALRSVSRQCDIRPARVAHLSPTARQTPGLPAPMARLGRLGSGRGAAIRGRQGSDQHRH